MPNSFRIREFARLLAGHWREILSVVVSLAVANVLFELGYRAYQYWTLPGRLFHAVSVVLPARNTSSIVVHERGYVHDAHAGYLYAPNLEGERWHPWYSRWRTNNHGHVSKFEYPRQKPVGEYRIAVVGDAMTAGVTNNVRWTELLEETLNASAKWKAGVGEKLTRVINFAVDGMGMLQFAGMVRHHVMGFEPDLIIVNFVSDDILRRVRYVAVPVSGVDQEANVRAYVRTYLDHIDWFSFRPELFIATVGRSWGMRRSSA